MTARTAHIAIHRQPWIKEQHAAEVHTLFVDGRVGLRHVLEQGPEKFLRSLEQSRIVLGYRRRE
jgi:hypothetical protein